MFNKILFLLIIFTDAQMVERSDLFTNYNGLILIDKPSGPTSFDVIRKLKSNFFFIK
ncbi:MAG: hypothetical protein PHR39_08020 [Actinomycetota bacterium]|nr:hypothetical protein [Actinomycetota bacterium]